MITSKQRATLRSQSNGLETIFQIGKGGISDMLVQQVNDALKAREMIKLRVLENAPVFAREAAAGPGGWIRPLQVQKKRIGFYGSAIIE